MHMIRHQVPFFDPAFSLLRQTPKYLPPNSAWIWPENCFLPILRNKNNMVLTLSGCALNCLLVS